MVNHISNGTRGLKEWSRGFDETKKKLESQEHLYGTTSLTKGTKGLEGIKRIRQVLKNFGDSIHLRCARLCHRFSTGEWVNNKTAYNLLNKSIKELDEIVKSKGNQISAKDQTEIEINVKSMRAVCKLLSEKKKEAEVYGKTIKSIDESLTKLLKDVELQIRNQPRPEPLKTAKVKTAIKKGKVNAEGLKSEPEVPVKEKSKDSEEHHKKVSGKAKTTYDVPSKTSSHERETIDDVGKDVPAMGKNVPAWRKRHEHSKQATEEAEKQAIKQKGAQLKRAHELRHKPTERRSDKEVSRLNVPPKLAEDIKSGYEKIPEKLRKEEIRQKTAEFDKKPRITDRDAETAVKDFPPPKSTIVQAGREVPKEDSVPIKREDAKIAKEHLKAIHEKKHRLREHLEEYINVAQMDSKIVNSFTDEEKLQLNALIRGNVRDLSRKEIKHDFKMAKSLIKSKYQHDEAIPEFINGFDETAKMLLNELKSLELQGYRFREKTGLPLTKVESQEVESRRRENTEKFEEEYRPSHGIGRPHEYEDIIRGRPKEVENRREMREEDDQISFKRREELTDPQLVAKDIKRNFQAIMNKVKDDPKFINTLGKVFGAKSNDNIKLRKLAGLEYESMSKKEASENIKEALTLISKGYSHKMPKDIRELVLLLNTDAEYFKNIEE